MVRADVWETHLDEVGDTATTIGGRQRRRSRRRGKGDFNRREWLWNLISPSFHLQKEHSIHLTLLHRSFLLIYPQRKTNVGVIAFGQRQTAAGRACSWKSGGPGRVLAVLLQSLWPRALGPAPEGLRAHLLSMEIALKHFRGLPIFKMPSLFFSARLCAMAE